MELKLDTIDLRFKDEEWDEDDLEDDEEWDEDDEDFEDDEEWDEEDEDEDDLNN